MQVLVLAPGPDLWNSPPELKLAESLLATAAPLADSLLATAAPLDVGQELPLAARQELPLAALASSPAVSVLVSSVAVGQELGVGLQLLSSHLASSGQ